MVDCCGESCRPWLIHTWKFAGEVSTTTQGSKPWTAIVSTCLCERSSSKLRWLPVGRMLMFRPLMF